MIGLGLRPTIRGVPWALTRASFAQRALAIAGSANVALLWAAQSGDTTTSTTLDTNARTITWDADASARISAQGLMAKQTFTAASSQYGTTPDTASLSFGNGTTDLAWSWVALINTSDTAANKTVVSKFDSGAGTREYLATITSAEVLSWQLWDQSAGVVVGLNSSSAVPLGSWILLGGSYDGGGGATAANGMVAYLNGAVLATSPTNNASYVATENLAAPLEIGSINAHAAQFFEGSQGFVLLCTGALSSTQMLAYRSLANAYYGLALTVDYPTNWGLVEYWGLNASGGSVDLVGSHAAMTLTNTNAVTLAAGAKLGSGAAQFAAASSQSLSIADSAPLSGGDVDLWLSAWCYPTALTDGQFYTIAGKNGASAGTLDYGLQITGTGDVVAFLIAGIFVTSTDTLTLNAWNFVMGYHDATNDLIGISINGGAWVTAATGGTTPPDSSVSFRIGARRDPASTDRFFDGRIDGVAFGKPTGIASLRDEIRDRQYNGGGGRSYPWA